MSVDVATLPAQKAKNFPLYRTVSRFARDPLRELERISHSADGAVARLDLGASHPFLVTHPDHAQQALRKESENFVRDGTFAFRFLLPFVPRSIPLPGDRAFGAGLRVMDETLYEFVDRFRYDPGEGYDIFTALCKARMTEGSGLDDRWVRDNLLSMWATSTETTTVALTWLWPMLDRNPEIAARLAEEIGRVVGDGEARPEHLHKLPYVKRVVQELLRHYPVGWIFPRIALNPTNIGGVPIKAGQTVLISPFLTHRLDSVWERPLEFDPERFTPEQIRTRHRYAYFPFGGGPHQCIGRHVSNVEAELILTSILSRFRPALEPTEIPVDARIGATPRPNQPLFPRLHQVDR